MPENSSTQTKSVIGYFSMEIGLRADIKQFAGGLGILAGDTLKTGADMALPMVGITILYKQGYFHQEFDDNGIQQEIPDVWDYESILTKTDKVVIVPMAGREVKAQIWKYTILGVTGAEVPVYFLDTDIEGNDQEDRYISYNLYTQYKQTRLRQEVMLGIGGVYALRELGYEVSNYHLNESHAAFGIIGLEEQLGSREAAKAKVVFTTHTPAEHGHVKYYRDNLQSYLAPQHMDRLAGDFMGDELHLTKFCMNNAKYVNAVAKRHGEVSRKMFPDYEIDSITNGIHVSTWAGKATQQLFKKHLPGWREKPENLKYAEKIAVTEIQAAHKINKQELIEYVKASTGKDLDLEVFTIGFARRVDGYKRSGLILRDIPVLEMLAEKYGGLQIIMSGKAYFDYGPAEELIAEIRKAAAKDLGKLKLVYLKDYNMNISQLMVQGCDIWLNNPIKPLEASGTSGMKAALNGTPNFSTIDGWWVEGWQEGITGWSIGGTDITESEDAVEAHDIYRKLEDIILPLFTRNKMGWGEVQRNAIALNGPQFSTHRMLAEYNLKGYSRR